ncbi:MAG: tetratricopeptide repeat protein [Myxococcales bacterium]|nr:tetratricopeptide repeat protein [Myxococcales bacterium]
MIDRPNGSHGDEVLSRSLDMDAVTAHLDRGWDLLSRGDLAGARVSANHILQHDAESPEGFALLGAIAREEGEAEEAVELFQKALDADPDYVDAMLHGADVAIHDLGDLERGLRLVDEAEELLEPDDEESAEVWLLRAEAALLGGDLEAARRPTDAVAARRIFADPRMYLRAGRLMIDTGRIDVAVDYLERAIEHEPSRIDGHYFLGLALDAIDPRRALAHLYEAHRLDGELELPPWMPPLEELETTTRAVVEELGEPLGPLLRRVPLRVAEQAPLELVAEGHDPRMAVYLAGIPAGYGDALDAVRSALPGAGAGAGVPEGGRAKRKTKGVKQVSKAKAKAKAKRDGDGATDGAADGVSPESAELFAVFVYRRSVAYWAARPDDLAREIERAFIIEGAFFFGFDDATVEAMLERCEGISLRPTVR